MEISLVGRVLDMAVAIQQIPAPTFAEQERAAFVGARFTDEGLLDIQVDETGNVYGRLPGVGAKPPLVVSAHIDSVFPRSTELTVARQPQKISGPGIGDNALGVAGLFGLLWSLRSTDNLGGKQAPHDRGAAGPNLPGDLWFVATVGEEGVGDLRGMQAVVERFGDETLAYIVLEGLALGQVYHRGLGVARYRIAARTMGGHSWVDYGRPSAVHELAALINRLVAIPISGQPRTSLNVGVLSGGTSINTIASEAYLELDLRSEAGQPLADLVARVEVLVQAGNRPGVEVSAEAIGRRPLGEISPQHPLVRLSLEALEQLQIQPCLNVGSTDANIPLSLGLPAICLGLTHGGGAHTVNEYIYTAPLSKGLEQLARVVVGAYQKL